MLLLRNLGTDRMAEQFQSHRRSRPRDIFRGYYEAAMACGASGEDGVESQDHPDSHTAGRCGTSLPFTGLHLGETCKELRCLLTKGRLVVSHCVPLGQGEHTRRVMHHNASITCSHLMPSTSTALIGTAPSHKL
jgi:hypothetical protein